MEVWNCLHLEFCPMNLRKIHQFLYWWSREPEPGVCNNIQDDACFYQQRLSSEMLNMRTHVKMTFFHVIVEGKRVQQMWKRAASDADG